MDPTSAIPTSLPTSTDGRGPTAFKQNPIIQITAFGVGRLPPAAVRELFAWNDWCHCEKGSANNEGIDGDLKHCDVALIVDAPGETDPDLPEFDGRLRKLCADLRHRHLGVLVLTHRPRLFADFESGVIVQPTTTPPDRARGALEALAHSQPILRQIDEKMSTMQRLSHSLHQHIEGMDRDMRMAARLQRDFLPRQTPSLGPVGFKTLYRPSNWVSGDIFDIVRLDEEHIGFYLADVVGHGVAAGLLTIYIKNAIQPKRLLSNGYALVPPSEVLGALNIQLIAQDLPDSQFVTAWYGMINARTLELTYAVAGHPPPMHVARNGCLSELHGEGCVLGINAEEVFTDVSLTLSRGDRLLLYSDGLEETLIAFRPPLPGMPTLHRGIDDILRRPADHMIAAFCERLDNTPGSLLHSDDVSMVVMDLDGESYTRTSLPTDPNPEYKRAGQTARHVRDQE